MACHFQNIAGYKEIPVAVKTLANKDPAVIAKFREEAELMKNFSHPNIVGLLGVCVQWEAVQEECAMHLSLLLLPSFPLFLPPSLPS